MLVRLSNWLSKMSSGRNLILSLSLYVLFGFGVMPNLRGAIPALSDAPGPLDLMFAYTPAAAFDRIAAYGPEGRAAYALMSLSVDVIYPIIYTLAFAILITFLSRYLFPAGRAVLRLNLLPVGIFFFDMLENASIVTLLMVYPAQPTALGWAASTFTTVKWVFAGFTILWSIELILIALFRAVRRGWRW